MIRLTHFCVVVLLAAVGVMAQQPKSSPTVSDDEFHQVLLAVSNEDWDTAVELSSKYLKQMKAEDERLPKLRYIYIYSAAGKVSEGRMDYDLFGASVKEFVGKNVVLPFRPIALECRTGMNFICPTNEAKDRLMVAASNKAGTRILAFEYTQLKEAFDFANHEDEPASIAGKIEAIAPNPNKSRLLIMRFFISEATLTLKEGAPKKQIAAANTKTGCVAHKRDW